LRGQKGANSKPLILQTMGEDFIGGDINLFEEKIHENRK